jgi:hypothetical protein
LPENIPTILKYPQKYDMRIAACPCTLEWIEYGLYVEFQISWDIERLILVPLERFCKSIKF